MSGSSEHILQSCLVVELLVQGFMLVDLHSVGVVVVVVVVVVVAVVAAVAAAVVLFFCFSSQ